MVKVKIAIFIFYTFMCLRANSAENIVLYISPTGNDLSDGTKVHPLASLEGARDKIRELRKDHKKPQAIRVIISEGNYFLSKPLLLTAEDSGTDGAPIVFLAENGSKPVFYGGKAIEGFEKVNDKLRKVFIPEVHQFGWNFEQLYVNGRRAKRAQFPNNDFYKVKAVTETIIEKGPGEIADIALQKISLYPEQAALFTELAKSGLEDAVVTFYHKWDNTRKRSIGYNAEDNAFYIIGKGMQPWNMMDDKTLFTIENVKSALDTPGEWYLQNDGYLYYVPKTGETIANTSCYAPILDQFIIIKGTEKEKVKNIRFENISFQVAGYKMPIMGNEPMQAAAFIDASIMIDYAQNIQFINCEVAHTGSNAIWFRKACSDGKVQHCYLHDLGAGAVKIGEIESKAEITNHITVDNNIMRSGGRTFPCAVALIIFNASDNTLTHNEIADFNYSGISVGWVWGYAPSVTKRNKIEFNHIHHLGWGMLSDMGGVYTLGASEGTTVSNNVIHHIYSNTYGGWGLYTDEGSTGIVLENNLVYSCKSSAFHQHYGKDNIVRNNIFYNQIHAQLEATRTEPHIGFYFTNNIIHFDRGELTGIQWSKANFVTDFNAFWDTRTKDITIAKQSFREWQKSGKDKHSIIADPTFADPDHLDFSVKNKSLISRIKFKPFDYTKAGVYGEKAWKELAEFDPNRAKQFDKIVDHHENGNNRPNAGQ